MCTFVLDLCTFEIANHPEFTNCDFRGILDGGQLLYPGSLPLKNATAIQQLVDAASSPASRIFPLLGIRRDAEAPR
jgi:hypothetical protein